MANGVMANRTTQPKRVFAVWRARRAWPGLAVQGAAGVLRIAGLLLLTGALACAPSSTDTDKLPPNIPSPNTVQNERGALAFYHQVLTLLPAPFDLFVAETGILTDELAGLPGKAGQGGRYTGLDSRTTVVMPDIFAVGYPGVYLKLHRLRGQAREARGFLAVYGHSPDSTDAYNEGDLRAHLYALEGYAEVFLADLYCSGIPLSTVDFQGDYTLTPGYSTKDVYLHAAGLFDSALALVSDSSEHFGPLAAVGKGRALLGAGQLAEAAAAVVNVPDGYLYQVIDNGADHYSEYGISLVLQDIAGHYADAGGPFGGSASYLNAPGMGDSEGGNGLPYVSSHDPRTPATELGPGPFGGTMYFPANYPLDGPVTLTVASGIEARLIQAEADLQADPNGGTWLGRLNTLRQTVGLADTTDPGAGLSEPAAMKARMNLVFRERAFWLYLTGHRQGDLRRLIRQYPGLGYEPNMVYPTSAFGASYPGGPGQYGTAIVEEVPVSEHQLNPKYTGCLHLGA